MNATQPTPSQLAALAKVRNIHGRQWKAALSRMWMYANYTSDLDGRALQQVRNNLGPSWLYSPRCDRALEQYAHDTDPARWSPGVCV